MCLDRVILNHGVDIPLVEQRTGYKVMHKRDECFQGVYRDKVQHVIGVLSPVAAPASVLCESADADGYVRKYDAGYHIYRSIDAAIEEYNWLLRNGHDCDHPLAIVEVSYDTIYVEGVEAGMVEEYRVDVAAQITITKELRYDEALNMRDIVVSKQLLGVSSATEEAHGQA